MTVPAAPAAAPAAGSAPAAPANGAALPADKGAAALPATPANADPKAPDAASTPTAKQLEEMTPEEVAALSKADPLWGKRFATLQRQARATRERETTLTTREKELESRAAKVAEAEALAKEFEADPFAAMQKHGIDVKKAVERWLNDGKPTPEHEAETQKQRLDRLEKEAEDRKTAEQQREAQQAFAALNADIAKTVAEGGDSTALIRHFQRESIVFETMRRAWVDGLPDHGMPAKTQLTIAKAVEIVETALEAEAKALQARLANAPKLGIAASAPHTPEPPKSTDTRAPSAPQTPPTQPSARKVTRPAPVGHNVKKLERRLSPQENREASMARALKKFS